MRDLHYHFYPLHAFSWKLVQKMLSCFLKNILIINVIKIINLLRCVVQLLQGNIRKVIFSNRHRLARVEPQLIQLLSWRSFLEHYLKITVHQMLVIVVFTEMAEEIKFIFTIIACIRIEIRIKRDSSILITHYSIHFVYGRWERPELYLLTVRYEYRLRLIPLIRNRTVRYCVRKYIKRT